jgi:nucleoside-diphosphate-sugar epimerase
MPDRSQTVLITGVTGNLGTRLVPQLASEFRVIGVDVSAQTRPPETSGLAQFVQMDVGEEESCHELVDLLRETQPFAVVHLAFVVDPVRAGVLDGNRMWQINVAGTARVMEAIGEVHRRGGAIAKFIFPSSVAVYGPELASPASETAPLLAHTLPYAVHKRECDDAVRMRAAWLGACSTYLLRPHIFAGATMQNYMIGALRGTPGGRGRIAQRLREKGTRLPLLVPSGRKYLAKQFQFVHVDDVARLIAYILRRQEQDPQLTILNVAGRGRPLSLQECARIANAKLMRLPWRALCGWVVRRFWNWGISDAPPEALPYMIGSYTMDTSRLRAFLGSQYEDVICHTIEEALADSFQQPVSEGAEVRAAARA